jgi:nitrite reductase/ring-hydroxylating ferredoxin subunit
MLEALPSADLPAGEGPRTQIRRVRVGDGHVLLARLDDGTVIAFGARCPHQRTALDDARVADGRVRCPLHGYVYDGRTGENIHPAQANPPEERWRLRPGHLPCHETVERDGWIWVAAEANAPPAAYDPDLETPPPGAVEAVTATTPVAASAGGATLQFLDLTAGSTVELRLPTEPRPGFAWQVAATGDAVTIIDETFEPGDVPCHLLRLAARAAGAATLSCSYADPSGTSTEVRTYIVRVAPG